MLNLLTLLDRFGFALFGCCVGLLFDGQAMRLGPTMAAVALALMVGNVFLRSRAKKPDDAAEQALRIIQCMPAHSWSADAKGRFTYVSPSVAAFTGHPKADLDPRGDEFGWRQVVHPDDYDRIAERWRHCLKTGERYDTEHRIRRFDGVYRWFRNSGSPSRDAQGNISAWYGTTIDIDEGKTLEAALLASERSLRQLIDTVPVLIWCATPEGEPSYINLPLAKYVGIALSDLDAPDRSRLASALQMAVHPTDRPVVERALIHSFTTGDPFHLRYRQRRADGVYRWTDGRARPMYDASDRILQWYGVCLDIDDEVAAQDELRRAQEALGRASQAASLAELSASIAHEVNQPLAAIVTNSNACQRWLTADPPNIERAQMTIERIIRNANGAADIVSRTRALFKQSIQARRRTCLGALITEAQELMISPAGQVKVNIEVEVEQKLPSVVCDPVQIQQVLINLIRNGIEAMETVDGARSLRIRATHEGDAVRIEVSDRGPGVASPETVFEPFVTTKQDGMGMGLAICRSIVEAHGGRLLLDTSQVEETTFLFTLPIEAKAAA